MDQSKKKKEIVGSSIVSQVFEASLFCHAYNSESSSSKRTAVVKKHFSKKKIITKHKVSFWLMDVPKNIYEKS
jgi:hypothetical protein